jgi:hypothetical protein
MRSRDAFSSPPANAPNPWARQAQSMLLPIFVPPLFVFVHVTSDHNKKWQVTKILYTIKLDKVASRHRFCIPVWWWDHRALPNLIISYDCNLLNENDHIGHDLMVKFTKAESQRHQSFEGLHLVTEWQLCLQPTVSHFWHACWMPPFLDEKCARLISLVAWIIASLHRRSSQTKALSPICCRDILLQQLERWRRINQNHGEKVNLW